MKKSLKTVLALTIALVMVVGMLPLTAAAVTEDPANGVFIKDAGTDYFNMDGASGNGNVVASIAWRYGSYVYFALNCHKNTSVDPEAFQINGVSVGQDNYWKLSEGTPIKLYDGPDAAEPVLTKSPNNGGSLTTWIVGRILLANTTLELAFENLHHAGGWEIAGVTIEAKLLVSHKYGDAEPRPDFDQSHATLTEGLALTINPVPEGEYVYDSVTIKIGGQEADLEGQGITVSEAGVVSFTTNGNMTANGMTIEYLYKLPTPEPSPTPTPTHKLTITYIKSDNSQAAETYSGDYEEGAPYSVTSPQVDGWDPDTAVVEGTMGDADVNVTVTYTMINITPVTHKLTITYVLATRDAAAPPVYTADLAEGAGYSVTSPTVEGYTPDRAVVEGTMGTEDIEETVTYTADPEPSPALWTLTIYYKYSDGSEAAPTYTEQLAEGAEYSVTSPTITGYTPDQAVVSGMMSPENRDLVVTYTANPGPTDDPGPSPSPEPSASPEPSPEPSAEPEPSASPEPSAEPEPSDAPAEPSAEPSPEEGIGGGEEEEYYSAGEDPEVLYGTVPITGDETMPLAWAGLSLLAIAGIVVMSIRPKKKDE